MFFKEIDKWSKKKLRRLNLLFSFLHFVALVLVPVIIVSHNYKLFESAGKLKLTAVGIIVVVILGLYAYTKLKKAIDDFIEKMNEQSEIARPIGWSSSHLAHGHMQRKK